MSTYSDHIDAEHIEPISEASPHFRTARARAGVLLLIVSDAVSVAAILAASGYLKGLNVLNLFRASGDQPPSFVPALISAILLLLSGAAYYWWNLQSRRVDAPGPRVYFFAAWILMILALVAEVWAGASIRYPQPFHAYESLIILMVWFSVFHFLLTSIIGLLIFGRILNGRLNGQTFIIDVTGYWWYYTVISGILIWLFSSFVL